MNNKSWSFHRLLHVFRLGHLISTKQLWFTYRRWIVYTTICWDTKIGVGAAYLENNEVLGGHSFWTTPYHTPSNGMIERFSRTPLTMLSTVLKGDKCWDHTLMLGYRTSMQETTPFSLMFSCEPHLPINLEYNLFFWQTIHWHTSVLTGTNEPCIQNCPATFILWATALQKRFMTTWECSSIQHRCGYTTLQCQEDTLKVSLLLARIIDWNGIWETQVFGSRMVNFIDVVKWYTSIV